MRIAVYTNILTPYRVHFFDLMDRECKERGCGFRVYCMAETEPERNWIYEAYQRTYTRLLPGKTINFKDFCIHLNRGIKKSIEEYRPDVIVMASGYFSPTNLRLLRLRKRYAFKTLFWSESHLNEERKYSGAKIFVREKLRERIYPQFTGFLYAGKLSLQFIKKYAGDCPHLFFLPNLINQGVFDYRKNGYQKERERIAEKYQIDGSKFNFICPARLSPVKGILEFLDLAGDSTVRDRFSVVIAGDGNLRDAIGKRAREKGVHVQLLGYKNEAEMVELYSVSDCFLMPSLSDSNPLTCIEALWSAKPLLVSNHVGNYPEVIRENQNGFVFDYNRREEALNKIETLVNASDEWLRNASAISYQIANNCYDSAKTVSNLIDFCGDISNE